MSGTTPSSLLLALDAKVLKFFKNTSNSNSTALRMQDVVCQRIQNIKNRKKNKN